MRTVARPIVLLMALALVVAACGDDGSVLAPPTEAPPTSAAPSTEAPETSTPTESTATTVLPPVTTGTIATPPETTATTAPPETTEPPPAVPVLTDFDASETYDDPPLILNVHIPIVSGVPAAAADAMNGVIGTEILGFSNGFRDEVLGGDWPDDPMGTSFEAAVGWSAPTVEVGLLSIVFDLYQYWQGAAHGNSAVATLNFDPQTGALLALTDILVPGTFPALATIAEQWIIDVIWGGDAAEASSWVPAMSPELLDDWSAEPGGLAFSFDQYEIGFGAMGAPTVVVPWSELTAVIDPAGPAGMYLP